MLVVVVSPMRSSLGVDGAGLLNWLPLELRPLFEEELGGVGVVGLSEVLAVFKRSSANTSEVRSASLRFERVRGVLGLRVEGSNKESDCKAIRLL